MANTKQLAQAGLVYRWEIERDDFVNEKINGFSYFYVEVIKHCNYFWVPSEIGNSNSIGEEINRFDTMIKIYSEVSTSLLKDGPTYESGKVNESTVKSIEGV